MDLIITISAAIIACVLGFFVGYICRKKIAESKIGGAEEKAKQIVEEGRKAAETKKKEALLEAKDEIHKSRTEFEKEIKDRRSEMSRQERRVQQKEESLDKKAEALEKKDELLNKKLKEVDVLKEETLKVKNAQLEILERISGLSVEEAKSYLLKNIESEVRHEAAILIKDIRKKPIKRLKISSAQLFRNVLQITLQKQPFRLLHFLMMK